MRKLFKFIGYTFALWLMASCFSYADNTLTFSEYVEDISVIKDNFSDIEYDYIAEEFEEIKNHQCVVHYFDNYAEVSPICFYYTDGLSFNFDDLLDHLIDNVDYFYDIYEQDSYEFFYYPTDFHYSSSNLDEYKQFQGSIYENMVLMYWEWKGKKINIDYDTLSELLSRRYSFYVVPTYLAGRGACSLQNYRIAVEKLNGYVLQPGEILNLNSLIKNNPKACKGVGAQYHMFYGGSCGSSTQLFRMALIMPYLTVLERDNHSKWWALYYGDYIMGDDASMYENSQRFTVRNDFDESIYFRVYEKDGVSYLVGAVPHKIYEYVKIKKDVDGLRSSVTKNVFDNMGNLLGVFQFDSKYLSITYSRA